MALPSFEDGGARHRLQARYRRDRRRVVSRQGAGAQILPGALASPDLDVGGRMKRLNCMIVSLAMATGVGLAQPPAAPAENDSLSYDKAVAKAWGQIVAARYVVDWCSNNVRGTKGPAQKAYKQWNTRNAALIADINRRMDDVMNPGGRVPAKEFEQRKADLMKRGAER